MLPATVVSSLKDLPHRVGLPPELEATILSYVRDGSGELNPPAQQVYWDRGTQLVDECVAYIDAELTRITEARFALGDANALHRKLLADPKRLAESSLTELKSRVAVEKGKWPTRTKDQMQDVLDRFDEQLRAATTSRHLGQTEMLVQLTSDWRAGVETWLSGVLDSWGGHHVTLLNGKTAAAVEPVIAELEDQLGVKLGRSLAVVSALTIRPGGLEPPKFENREEIPTKFESFLESLKGGLNTVAMIAGMIIVPVVGFFSDDQPMHVRALIMGGCVAPILLFSVWETGKMRQKFMDKAQAKALVALRKEFDAHVRTRVERFRVELERHALDYLTTAQARLVAQAEQAIVGVFAERELKVAKELTRVQLEADRLAERITGLKQARSVLTGQVLVELRKRAKELKAT